MAFNDITHIDIQVIRNLLISRLNEGRDLLKVAYTTTEWKRREKLFQDKCKAALSNIEEAIKIKEGKNNESSSNQTSTESNEKDRETRVQNGKI